MDNDGNNQNQSRLRLLLLFGLGIILVAALIFGVAKGTHKPTKFPQADQSTGTTFQGLSAFISNGLTTDQTNDLIKAFSTFAPNSKNVSIDTSSISPGPRDPNKISPFSLNFKVAVDSSSYRGVVSYSDLTSVRLILYDSSGKQVFDSGTVKSSS